MSDLETQVQTSRRMDSVGERHRFRLWVALIMAAVSLASAYVSYVAAQRSSAAEDLSALASQQSAEEQQVEQQVDSMVLQDKHLTAMMDPVLRTYQQYAGAAAAIRASDPDRAARLDLMAQGSSAEFSQLYPFHISVGPYVDDGRMSFDEDRARESLRVLDGHLYRTSSELTHKDADEAESLAQSTVLVVFVLVAALLLLTLGHTLGGRRGVWFAGFGVAVSLAAVGWFTVLGIDAAIPLLVGIAVVAVVLVLLRLRRVRDWLAGFGHEGIDLLISVPEHPEAMGGAGPDGPTSGFDRYAAVVIAVATLLGAGVGYLHGQASADSSAQSWHAQDLGVKAIGDLRAHEGALVEALDTYRQSLMENIDSWNATQQASYADWTGDALNAAELKLTASQKAVLAAADAKRSGLATLATTGVFSGDQQLRELRAEAVRSSAKLAALQDAANAKSRQSGARAGAYLAVLSWLAVAVYLLGLSLIFRVRQARLVLATVGTVLVAVALARGGLVFAGTAGSSTSKSAVAAADAYARGVVAETAGDPTGAVRAYQEAVKLRPDFGIAHRDLAQATFESGSIQGAGLRSAFTEESANRAIASLRAAQSNYADTAGVRLNLGAMLFHRSINTGSIADMQESVANTRVGLALGEGFKKKYGVPHINELVGRMNLALAELGTGDAKSAKAEYAYVGTSIAGLEPGYRSYVVGAALAPLDRLRDGPRPVSERVIEQMKSLVVSKAYKSNRADMTGAASRMASPTATGTEKAKVTSATIDLFPSIVQWHATIPNLNTASDTLALQWYRLDPAAGAWTALPVVSGPVDFGTGFFPSGNQDGYWGNNKQSLANSPPECVQPGQYRLEVYLDGRLQKTAEATFARANDNDTPLIAPDIGVGLCQPSDWTVERTPGQAISTAAADGSRGLAVVRVFQPMAAGGEDPRAIAIDRVVASGRHGLPDGIDAGAAFDSRGTVFGGAPSLWRVYHYPGGLIWCGASLNAVATAFVACEYGPATWVTSEEGVKLLPSVILL